MVQVMLHADNEILWIMLKNDINFVHPKNIISLHQRYFVHEKLIFNVKIKKKLNKYLK